ncbi:hypothetical protein B296_00030613 [Ensete ventricosum]|uniref:DEK-C domain-containing protein n=1 Tax=Ensete ventricosum TaxID=4639 RepID=A0A426X8W0_ENSVE|nr:hypothetical protein B296_00030613 [Ensete ventricosum]
MTRGGGRGGAVRRGRGAMVSDAELVGRLREVLRASDLSTTTTTSVRRQLEEDFGIDLSDKKAFIRQQVDLFLSELHDSEDAEEAEEEEEDAAAPAEAVKEEEEEEEDQDGPGEEEEEEEEEAGGIGEVLDEEGGDEGEEGDENNEGSSKKRK